MPRTIAGSIDLPAVRDERYLYLPFEVEEGATRIDVRYRYDKGSTLDLGLLEPGIGPFPSRQGFRGWSGSARSDVFVARDAATPGYLAGPLPAGSWRVVLGLAQLDPGGCRYRVEIELDRSPRAAAGAGTLDGPDTIVTPGAGWYRGDLHSHSHHSDAKGSLEDLIAAAQARGLDFLAVTDHNTSAHHQPLRAASSRALLLLPGEEITTYRGHANVWGVRGWVDFRITEPAHIDKLVAQVHERGGLFTVNHPRATPHCRGCDWEHPIPAGADCFEVWNGPWAYRNWEALERCDALLRRGRRLTLVGGSDRHQPGWPDHDPEILWVGSPTTWSYLEELSEKALLNGLRTGRAFISQGPDGPRIELTVGETTMGSTFTAAPGAAVQIAATVQGARGERLRYVGAQGAVREAPIATDSFCDHWQWVPRGPFLRLEVLAQGDAPEVRRAFEELRRRHKVPPGLTLTEVLARPRRRALSNPVYLSYAES